MFVAVYTSPYMRANVLLHPCQHLELFARLFLAVSMCMDNVVMLWFLIAFL